MHTVDERMKRAEEAIQKLGISLRASAKAAPVRETLALAFQVVDTHDAAPEEIAVFRGIASAYQVPIETGPPRLVIRPGAFSESLRSVTRLPLLWAHNPDEPIGSCTDFLDTERELRCTLRVVVGMARGRDAAALLRARAVDSLSIGFTAIKVSFGKYGTENVRFLELADLMEISVVVWPANPRAKMIEPNESVARRLREAAAVVADARSRLRT